MLRNGDNVILGVDMNEDVQTGKLAKRLKEFGLIEFILSIHPSQSPPATFNRNNSRTPVDAIWGNSSLEIISAGYGHLMEGTHLYCQMDINSFGLRLVITPY